MIFYIDDMQFVISVVGYTKMRKYCLQKELNGLTKYSRNYWQFIILTQTTFLNMPRLSCGTQVI